MRKGRYPEQSYQTVWVFIPTANNFCGVSAYQGIEHQSVKRVAVRVLHHDVEESIQGVLQELKWQMHIIAWQANNKIGHLTKKTTHGKSGQAGRQEWDAARSAGHSLQLGYNFKLKRKKNLSTV